MTEQLYLSHGISSLIQEMEKCALRAITVARLPYHQR